MLKVDPNTRRVIDAIKQRLKTTTDQFEPNVRNALQQVGILISREAAINARRQGMIDSGRLINSIRYEFFIENNRQGIYVGSFGVPYAAINEFGGPFTERQRRAMFAAMSRRGGSPRPSKGVIMGDHWRARPYLRPAITANTSRIVDILREAVI